MNIHQNINNMETKEEKHREQLRLKMVDLQNQADVFRRKIRIIDTKKEQSRRDKVMGKCFLLPEYGGYARVEGFTNDNSRPSGTKVSIYGAGKYKRYHLSYNDDIWFEDIEKGKQISHSEFNKYIRQAKAMMKTKNK